MLHVLLFSCCHLITIPIPADIVISILELVHQDVFVIASDPVTDSFQIVVDQPHRQGRSRVTQAVLPAAHPDLFEGVALFEGVGADAFEAGRQFQMVHMMAVMESSISDARHPLADHSAFQKIALGKSTASKLSDAVRNDY